MLSERLPHGPAAATVSAQATTNWFDWAMLALSTWFLGGLYLDGWAHSHGKVDSTFFTPWHAVFYSGFVAMAILLGLPVAQGILQGRSWRESLPRGYGLAVIGAPLFALGGVGDLIWHSLFGIERGIDALLSPTHLLLAASMGLIFSGLFQATAQQASAGRIPLPALLALCYVLAVATFITEFAHPFVYILAREARYGDVGRALGVASIMLQSALLIGTILIALRRWHLPPGTLTFLFTFNAALMTVFEDHHWVIVVAACAGLCADLLVQVLRPSPERPWALRLFASVVPALLYLFYFVGVMRTGHNFWSIHLWVGSVVMAAVIGLLISLLVRTQTPGYKEP